jgi:hypothetical protein
MRGVLALVPARALLHPHDRVYNRRRPDAAGVTTPRFRALPALPSEDRLCDNQADAQRRYHHDFDRSGE